MYGLGAAEFADFSPLRYTALTTNNLHARRSVTVAEPDVEDYDYEQAEAA